MWHTIKVHVEIEEANVVWFGSTRTFLKRNTWRFCDSNKLYWLCVQMSKGMQVQASEFQISVFLLGFFWSSVWFYFLTKLRAPEVINSAAYKPQKYQFYIIKYCTYKTFTKHRYKITASFVPSSQIAPFRPTDCYASPCFFETRSDSPPLWEVLRPVWKRQALVYQHQRSNSSVPNVRTLPPILRFESNGGWVMLGFKNQNHAEICSLLEGYTFCR